MKAAAVTLFIWTVVCVAAPAAADNGLSPEILADGGYQNAAADKLERTKRLFAEPAVGAEAGGSVRGAAWKNTPQPELAGSGFKMLQALGLCIGLLLIGMWTYKRFAFKGTYGGGRRMRVIERVPLASKTALLLVEIEGRRVLLSVGSERVSYIPYAQDALTEPHYENSMDVSCADELKISLV